MELTELAPHPGVERGGHRGRARPALRSARGERRGLAVRGQTVTVAALDVARGEVVVPALATAGVATRVLGGVSCSALHLGNRVRELYHGPPSLLPSLTLVSWGLGGLCILQLLYMLAEVAAGAG